MRPRIVLSEVAGSRFHFARLPPVARGDGDARAEAVTIAAGADEAHEERAPPVAAVVPEQLGSAGVVGDDEIEVAIVVDIPRRQRAADRRRREPAASLAAD